MLRNLNIIEQLINLYFLVLIVVTSILIMTANYYWLGLGNFFVGLLVLIVSRYKASDSLEELLIMYPLILVAIVVGSLTQGWLMGDQRAGPIPALDGLVAALPNSYPATLFISLVVGLAAALLLAGILFLLLGLSFISVIIEGGEIKGKERDKQILDAVGGPGRVRIYPEQVVVFHKNGKITRAAGLGATLLRRGEKIKAIIPLGNKAGVQEIENVLTKDRIALTLNVAHGAGIELVSGTKKRLEDMKDKVARDENALELLKREVRQAVRTDELEAIKRRLAEMEAQEEPDQETIDLLKKYKDALEQLEKDKKTVAQLQKIVDSGQTVGDEHNQCYVDIAKLVAAKAPDPWSATKGGVGVNLRDVFMTNDFEDLFKIEGEAQDLKAKIDQRKIAEIENFVLDRVKGVKLRDGIVLGFVDIVEIYFSETLLRSFYSARKNHSEPYITGPPNPYIVGPPIDIPELFYGRENLITNIIRGLLKNHIAIQGPRRSGKSSLLIQLSQRLRDMDDSSFYFVPVLFDCHETTEAFFFYDLMDVLLTTLNDREPELSRPTLIFQSLDQAQIQNQVYNNRHFKKDLDRILTTLTSKVEREVKFILLLDEGDALNEYSKATQRKIRNLISQYKAITMVWAGTNILVAAGDPTSPWYNLQVTYSLSPLSEMEAEQLIRQPAANLGYTYQPEAIQRILERADGQPYIIQYLCYRAVEAMLDEGRSVITLADVEKALAQLAEETSAQDVSSVVYQPREQSEVDLSLAERSAPYPLTDEDDAS